MCFSRLIKLGIGLIVVAGIVVLALWAWGYIQF